MERHAIDRWADTILFRSALMLAALGVAPVLLLGIAFALIGGLKLFNYGWPSEIEPQAIAVMLLSTGGVCGFVGYLRAHGQPRGQNPTATLMLLAAGILAAITVAGIVIVATLADGFGFRGPSGWHLLFALFATANLVWATAGIAWMQRLLRRYAETAGHPFDGLPVVLLFVALALATAAAVITAAL